MLIVDDHVQSLRSLQLIFGELGLPCSATSDSTTADQMICRRINENVPMYKLIILDFQMEGMSCVQLCQEIRKNLGQYPRRQYKRIPPMIVGITAVSLSKLGGRGRELTSEMDEVYIKPLDK